MNKNKMATVVSVISAAAVFSLGTGICIAETKSSTDTTSSQKKDGLSTNKKPGLTRDELLKRSQEKSKTRREIIKAAQSGYTTIKK